MDVTKRHLVLFSSKTELTYSFFILQMRKRVPSTSKGVRTRSTKSSTYPKLKTPQFYKQERERKQNERKKWSEAQKEKNREQSKIRMQKMRGQVNVRTYTPREHSLKDMTEEERKAIRREQRKQQRERKKSQKDQEQNFEDFVNDIAERNQNPNQVSSSNTDFISNAVCDYLKPRKKSSKTQKDLLHQIFVRSKLMGRKKKETATLLKVSLKRLNNSSQTEKRGRKPVSTVIVDQIHNCYMENSRPLPCKQRNGQFDVYLMEATIKEVYNIFCRQNPSIKISFAKFSMLRPKNVKPPSSKHFLSCLCEVCLNMKLKVEALMKNGIVLPDCFRSLYELCCKTTCDPPLKSCFYGDCLDCGTHQIEPILNQINQEKGNCEIQYKTWKKTETDSLHKIKNVEGKTETQKKKVFRSQFVVEKEKVSEILQELKLDLKPLTKHLFIAKHQQTQHTTLLKSLPKNTIVLDIDYSENVSTIYREAPQADHYNKKQFTLFPIVAQYWKSEADDSPIREEFLLITDDLTHTEVQADILLHKVLMELKQREVYKENTWCIVFSDRCPTQFSNNHMAFILSQKMKFQWNFFGPRHGKNQSDTAGANFKTKLSNYILRTGQIISNLKDFKQLQTDWEQPTNKSSRRTIMTATIEEIQQLKQHYKKSFTKMVGIKQYHQLTAVNGNGKLILSELSCFCDSCRADYKTPCSEKGRLCVVSMNKK